MAITSRDEHSIMDKALVSGSSVDNNNKLAVIFRTEICENTMNYAISSARSGVLSLPYLQILGSTFGVFA